MINVKVILEILGVYSTNIRKDTWFQ